MGHAISGGGFFNIDVEPMRNSPRPGEVFAAIIQFKESPLTEAQLADELKHVIDDLWNWQVRKLTASEFVVVFPSKETLRLCARSGKLFLSLSKTDASIREAFLAPRPSLLLPSVWVQLTGVPEALLERERLMAAFVMIGRLIDVDELSVQKWDREPVRMRFNYRYPERIKGSIQICVNGEGFTVGVQAELSSRGGAGGSGGPPRPPPSDDLGDFDSDERSSDGETWNRHGRKGQDGEKNKEKGTAAGSQAPGSKQHSVGLQGSPAPGVCCEPTVSEPQGVSETASLPVIDEYGSNIDPGIEIIPAVRQLQMEMRDQSRDEDEFLLSDTVSQITELDSPAVIASRALLKKAATVSKQLELGKECAMGEKGQMNLLKDIPGAQRAKRTKTEAYSRRKPSTPTTQVRKSSRINGESSELIMEKAQRLAAEKNLDKAKGTDHSILDLHSDSHLSSVIRDSCVLFNPAAGTPGEILSMVRAKEQLQAALAEVRLAQELAVASKKEAEATKAAATAAGAARAAAALPAEGAGTPSQTTPLQEQVEGGTVPLAEGEGGETDLSAALGRPAAKRGRPKRACAKRPVLTVQKGQGIRKGSLCAS
jgi:hypothetical protein